MEEKENKESIWTKIVNFFKKGWTLLIIPVILFIIRLFTGKGKDKELKKEIKEINKEIKEEKKDIQKQTTSVEKKEDIVEQKVQEVKDEVENHQKNKDDISEILPGIKK